MITAMDKSGQWVKALQVFEAMRNAKLQPNIISMSFSEALCIPSLKLTARPLKSPSFLVNTIKMVDFPWLCYFQGG